uniref:Uncharacterized protein n=1 Tax=Burkholderia sp. (strain CCGE1003) TaxID=640512 RepID=E1T8D0_BURSG
MAGLNKHVGGSGPIPRAVTGRQSYFLDVTGPANGCEISVVSFSAVERIGEPYRVIVEIAHPGSLSRDDYLGRDATLNFRRAAAARHAPGHWPGQGANAAVGGAQLRFYRTAAGRTV